MLTIEQVDAIIEEALRMASSHRDEYCYSDRQHDDVDRHEADLKVIRTLARECLEAGTFSEGIEAAAKLCEAKGIGPWTPDAIRQLKRPS